MTLDMYGMARANPLAGNPLHTRADLQRAVTDLYNPLLPYISPGGARVRLGSFGTNRQQRVDELEGFARPLYGIVPLVAGGGVFAHWDRVRQGLIAGTDPNSREYWGAIDFDRDQRMVEAAPIGIALAFLPEHVWDPLPEAAKGRLIAWLRGVLDYEPVPNNWNFWRVMIGIGLRRVGVAFDPAPYEASLDRLESFHAADGWFHDGYTGNVDYYLPWAIHTLGLVYAASGQADPARAARFRERAAAFAKAYQHWFDAEGSAIPFGRSLTYRTAQAGFWGALAMADVQHAIPWGGARGMLLRNLRWWSRQPISDRDGVLSVGYAYDNRYIAESYTTPQSPYWAMLCFFALMAPETHGFWTEPEVALPPLTVPQSYRHAAMVLDRDEHHAVALMAQRGRPRNEHSPAKYRRFAYSSRFGFNLDIPPLPNLPIPYLADSMLTLHDGDQARRRDGDADIAGVQDGVAYLRWRPWPDVTVDTVLAGGTPWQFRLHRIRSARALTGYETGFAIASLPETLVPSAVDNASAWVSGPAGSCAILDLNQLRTGGMQLGSPNANVMTPHTVMPYLTGDIAKGEHELACAVWTGAATLNPPAPPPCPEIARKILDQLAATPTPQDWKGRIPALGDLT
jgi:hypothetical protein